MQPLLFGRVSLQLRLLLTGSLLQPSPDPNVTDSADNTFRQLALPAELLDNLETLDYHRMTPVQAASLPAMLDGRDVIAQAQTGSGKTAAFGLALLARLQVNRYHVQSLVLCPTRELADQVAGEIRRLARGLANVKVLTLCGGTPFGPQLGSLEHGAHVIVGTPGRVEEHVRKGSLKLAAVNTLVLDEADRMLDMGFQDQLEAIMAAVPAARQTLLFSATFEANVRRIANRLMRNPVQVDVTARHADNTIRQHFYRVASDNDRFEALHLLLLHHRPESSVVFCNTKKTTQEVADALCQHGFSALALHGDLEQRDRDRILVLFANKSASILVATDVAARGLDIDALDAVFNYEVARDPEIHVHRIGRTGRAGQHGIACTLVTPQDRHRVARLSDAADHTVLEKALPNDRQLDPTPITPVMTTLQLDGGKKQKLRPGDVLGALTAGAGIGAEQVGKIKVTDQSTYVAVHRDVAKTALAKLGTGKIKGRSFRVRRISR